MSDLTEIQKKLMADIEAMSPEEHAEFISNKLKEAHKSMQIDAIGKFILNGLGEKSEDTVASILLSVVVNLGINKEMCPICFTQHMTEVVGELFKEIPIGDNDHDYEFQEAEEISNIMRGDAIKH